jgi:hypothetical protein
MRGAGLLCAAVAFLPVCGWAGSIPKEDSAWKNYYNAQGHYCVDYPSRWISGDAFEGAGFFLKPAGHGGSKSLAEIDVAVLKDRAAGTSLVGEAQLHLDGLRKFELAEHIELLEQHDTLLYGNPALLTRDTYYDPQNAARMIDEIIFADHDGMLYRLELASRADEVERFEAVFRHQVSSFRFDCPPHAIPRDFAASGTKKERAVTIAHPVAIYPHPLAN